MEFWKESLKKFRLPGFKPWPVQYWCRALTSCQASKPTGSWSLNWFKIYPGKIIVMIFSAFICSSCSSNNYMKFIYLLFQENNTQDQKIHVWLSPQRKQEHNPGDSKFSKFEKPNQGRPMQGSESGQRSVTDFPLLLNYKWPNVSRVALITRNSQHCSQQQKLSLVNPLTAWPVNGYMKQRRQIWGVIVNSNTGGI